MILPGIGAVKRHFHILLFIVRFGKVVSGQDVVSAVEQVGSESGKTRVPVLIADCGQLR